MYVYFIIYKIFGRNMMKGKRKGGEKEKKVKKGRKRGKKREKINKGKNYDKICYLMG